MFQPQTVHLNSSPYCLHLSIKELFYIWYHKFEAPIKARRQGAHEELAEAVSNQRSEQHRLMGLIGLMTLRIALRPVKINLTQEDIDEKTNKDRT